MPGAPKKAGVFSLLKTPAFIEAVAGFVIDYHSLASFFGIKKDRIAANYGIRSGLKNGIQ